MNLSLADLQKSFEWFKERWHHKTTLALVLVVAASLLIYFFAKIDLSKVSTFAWISTGIVLTSIYVVWLYPRRIPRAPRKSVGILVAVSSETTGEERRLKADFTDVLRSCINESTLRQPFEIIELNPFHCRRITDRNIAAHYLTRSGARLLLFGRVRYRVLEGKPNHILDLNGVVSHRPIAEDLSKRLSAEFTTIFPRRVIIQEEVDVFAFEVSAKILDLVGKYMVAVATMTSGEIEYAQQLLEEISNRIDTWPTQLPTVQKIKARLPQRLAEVYELHCRSLYFDWYTSRNKEYLKALEELASKLLQLHPDSYGGLMTRAICAFVLRRDVREALATVKKCEKVKDCVWMYSKAFLLAYQGKLKLAKKTYWRAFKTPSITGITQLEVEIFLQEVIAEEPDKYYLYYFLGLINRHAKDDKEAALRDFQSFIDKAKNSQLGSLVTDARKYVDEISAELASTPM